MIATAHGDAAREVARLTGWDLDAYAAEQEWSGVAIGPVGITRDSGPLERSNMTAACAILDAAGARYSVARFGHWAVGWVEEIAHDAGDAATVAAVAAIRARLEDYPVLDEDGYSALEWDDNHPDGTHCYAERDAECHAVDSLSRIVPWRDARGRFCSRDAWDMRR